MLDRQDSRFCEPIDKLLADRMAAWGPDEGGRTERNAELDGTQRRAQDRHITTSCVPARLTATGPMGHQVTTISPEWIGDFCSLQATEEFGERMRKIESNVYPAPAPCPAELNFRHVA
jgi:hypothetical protein